MTVVQGARADRPSELSQDLALSIRWVREKAGKGDRQALGQLESLLKETRKSAVDSRLFSPAVGSEVAGALRLLRQKGRRNLVREMGYGRRFLEC